jgi:RNA-splicing ligase RtcB
VHRKGATRALLPGHPDLDPVFAEVGQPVLIPGDEVARLRPSGVLKG